MASSVRVLVTAEAATCLRALSTRVATPRGAGPLAREHRLLQVEAM